MRRSLALALIAALATFGCGDSNELSASPEPAAGQEASDLWGLAFRTTQITKLGKEVDLVDDTTLDLFFHDHRPRGIGWGAGCNGYGAPTSISSSRLAVGGIGHTEMACSGSLMRQDHWVAEFFARDPRWRLIGRQLTLWAHGTVIELERGGWAKLNRS